MPSNCPDEIVSEIMVFLGAVVCLCWSGLHYIIRLFLSPSNALCLIHGQLHNTTNACEKRKCVSI